MAGDAFQRWKPGQVPTFSAKFHNETAETIEKVKGMNRVGAGAVKRRKSYFTEAELTADLARGSTATATIEKYDPESDTEEATNKEVTVRDRSDRALITTGKKFPSGTKIRIEVVKPGWALLDRGDCEDLVDV